MNETKPEPDKYAHLIRAFGQLGFGSIMAILLGLFIWLQTDERRNFNDRLLVIFEKQLIYRERQAAAMESIAADDRREAILMERLIALFEQRK